MTSAIYIPDKNANDNDYLSSNGAWGLIGNTDIISAVAFPKGRHIYSSEGLNVHAHWNRIYIKTSLSDYSLDIKNRLVPVFFMTKVLNPVHALDKFVKKLEEYGDNVESSVLDELKKALKRERRRRTVFMVVATLTFLAICLIYK